MGSVVVLNVYKSTGIGDTATPNMKILATEPVPEIKSDGWERMYREMYQGQAEKIYTALKRCLPGGTLDNLFAVMAKDRASLLRVSL